MYDEQEQKWYREYTWKGKYCKEECAEHFYAWSGEIPCTGIKYCLKCGKPEEEPIKTE